MPVLSRAARSLLPALGVAGMMAASPAVAQDRGASPFWTERCPIPEGVQGYPVSVRGAEPAYAQALADALARQWEPPSRGRGAFDGLGSLRARVQPPEPRWPQDGLPAAGDTARVAVTLYRAARTGEATLLAASGNRAFDRSVVALFRTPAPASPALPPLPAGTDSVRVEIGFGVNPAADAATVRFAAQQAPVRLVPGSLQLSAAARPGGRRLPSEATIKYDVDAAGAVVPGSIEYLGGTDRAFATQISQSLVTARATPAQSNCRAVTTSVVQKFRAR